VQVYQNTFNYYQNLIDSILPVLVILFAGSLSDRFGRKLPLATVLAGFVAFSVVYIVTALNPNWPVEVLYAATTAVDITGSWVHYMLLSFVPFEYFLLIKRSVTIGRLQHGCL